MVRWRAFTQLVLARLREFYREPEVIFWVYGFPLLLAIVLGLAFSEGEPEPPAVDVQREPDAARAERIAQVLRAAKFKVEVKDADDCAERLRTGKTALYVVLDGEQLVYKFDKVRAESVLARHWTDNVLARSAAGTQPAPARDEHITEPGRRYIDWLLPGLLGMNIMGGGLFGVGFALVDMRVRKLFKRLLATPMRRPDFLLSLMASRLLFLLPEMAILLVFGWIRGVPMLGSFATVMLVILVGAAAFSGLGLLLGCRTEKLETMSGFINLVMLPSYLLAGVFFSSERFPDAIQPFIQALPLTHVNDAMRKVMLEGAGLDKIWWHLAVLAAWGVVCFTLALRWFRWR